MAPKRQQVSKGKAVAGSSGEPEQVFPGRAKRRDRDQIDRDNQAAWEASIKGRGVKNERHIIEDVQWPANFAPFRAIRAQGMNFWFEPNPGYNNALVEEFYKNMILPEPGTFLNPGARIVSKIGNIPVFINAEEIARAWEYVRPSGPTNFPAPELEPDDEAVNEFLYDDRRNARDPHWPGRFTSDNRFLNQVICYNLYPRGKEGAPQKYVGYLMFVFMNEDTVCDWAQFAFGHMCDFRDAPVTLRMPFPCLITKILRSKHVLPRKYDSNDPMSPKDMDSSILKRSRAQVRVVEGSLLAPPPPNASTKTWLEKIFGCVTGLARGQRKLKREQRQLARNQADMVDRQRHMEAQLAGQNPGPFQPRQWPELEVSDDFGGDPEEEHSDAGFGDED
jgi:hypothetical protein